MTEQKKIWGDFDTVKCQVTETHAKVIIQQICSELGFDCVTFGFTGYGENALGVSNCPEVWGKFYTAQNMHHIDPRVRVMLHRVTPVDWSEFEEDEGWAQIAQYMETANLPTYGISIPMINSDGFKGQLGVSKHVDSRQDWETHIDAKIKDVFKYAEELFTLFAEIEKQRNSEELPLTTKEIKVLALAAEGHKATEIATELSLSPRTIETHLQFIRAKLGTKNNVHSVTVAFKRGLLTANMVAGISAHKHVEKAEAFFNVASSL